MVAGSGRSAIFTGRNSRDVQQGIDALKPS
jgi:hypothetical protein